MNFFINIIKRFIVKRILTLHKRLRDTYIDTDKVKDLLTTHYSGKINWFFALESSGVMVLNIEDLYINDYTQVQDLAEKLTVTSSFDVFRILYKVVLEAEDLRRRIDKSRDNDRIKAAKELQNRIKFGIKH